MKFVGSGFSRTWLSYVGSGFSQTWLSYVGSGFSRTCLAALVTISLVAIDLPVSAQLAPPNGTGVAMGHLHFQVKDVDATRKFWLALGGREGTRTAGNSSIVFPDVIVMLSQGTPAGGSAGSVVNHVAFRVRSFGEVEAAGFTVQRLQQFPGVGSVTTPDGERIELFENAATNLTFTPDVGPIDPVAARHNRPLTGPIAFHHIHLNVPADAVLEAKSWYARVFGGTPGKRSNYDAVDLPGVNINISAAATPLQGTAGRALDSIGFEVSNLAAFCRRLDSMGLIRPIPTPPPKVVEVDGRQVVIEQPIVKPCDVILGNTAAFRVDKITITDPWGTTIALTEGLRERAQQ